MPYELALMYVPRKTEKGEYLFSSSVDPNRKFWIAGPTHKKSKGHLVNVSDHVEGDLWKVVIFAIKDLLEAGDGLFNGHQLAGVVGEHLCHL